MDNDFEIRLVKLGEYDINYFENNFDSIIDKHNNILKNTDNGIKLRFKKEKNKITVYLEKKYII